MDTPVDRDAVLAVLGQMNAAIRAAQTHAAPAEPDGHGALDTAADDAHARAADALPDWIGTLTQAVGYRTWTIVFRHHGADRSGIDAIVGPDLHHALLARALARHPDWTTLPDDQAVARLLAEDWPGAVAIAGEHTAFVFGGDDE
ncbi:hypothetical protein [Catenulispora subtropica]|uniref:Uncharacterized protein n=1 Tax=Catenulispora subtropica TaxID=450798 RepID=A0ABP5ELT3_9ACTN